MGRNKREKNKNNNDFKSNNLRKINIFSKIKLRKLIILIKYVGYNYLNK